MALFRPINLCNAIYKIAAKMVANRLKAVLPSIVSETRSAYVPGRLITDNVIAAFEVNRFLTTKSSGKTGHCSLKIDMSKAYDRIEWCFLKKSMTSFGFDDKFINIVMRCVSTVSFLVLINVAR